MRPRLLLDAGAYSLVEDRLGGIGLRIAEFAQVLSERFNVRVAVDDLEGAANVGDAELVENSDWDQLVGDSDAVFFFDLPDRQHLEAAVAKRRLIVCENAAPIEQLEYPSLLAGHDPAGRHTAMVADFRRQLEVSHHFLARSRVERATLAANLCLVGRLDPSSIAKSRTADQLISLVPIGFGAQALDEEAASEVVPSADALWTGGMWTYFAPHLLVEAVALCHRDGTEITAQFLHARPERDTAGVIEGLRKRTDELGIEHAVGFETKPLNRSERAQRIRGARVLVAVARPGLENESCVRLRARDSRLFAVPTIVDPFGATAEELHRDELAVVLAKTTAEDLAEALKSCVRQPHHRPPVAELHHQYRYDRTLAPFINWLEFAA